MFFPAYMHHSTIQLEMEYFNDHNRVTEGFTRWSRWEDTRTHEHPVTIIKIFHLNLYCWMVHICREKHADRSLKRNPYIQENAFENVIFEMVSILSQPQCVTNIFLNENICIWISCPSWFSLQLSKRESNLSTLLSSAIDVSHPSSGISSYSSFTDAFFKKIESWRLSGDHSWEGVL